MEIALKTAKYAQLLGSHAKVDGFLT